MTSGDCHFSAFKGLSAKTDFVNQLSIAFNLCAFNLSSNRGAIGCAVQGLLGRGI